MDNFGKAIHFQTLRDAATIVKTALWILEHETNLTQEEYLNKRKCLLDLLGKTDRNLYNLLDQYEINFKQG